MAEVSNNCLDDWIVEYTGNAEDEGLMETIIEVRVAIDGVGGIPGPLAVVCDS